jgi:HEAT repeats
VKRSNPYLAPAWVCTVLWVTALSCLAQTSDEAPLADPRPMPPVSLLRVGGLLAVPSGDVVGHAQYRFNGSLQYFSSSEFGVDEAGAGDTTDMRQFNYGTELLIGLENRAEIGFFYGQDFALSFKALLLEEDALWPNIVFGIRSLFGSAEADLYGVTESAQVRRLRGESYMMAAKTFAQNTRLHAGASMLNGANKSLASFDFGLEQNLGAGAFLGYELFERYSDFHHSLSLTWRFGPVFAMHVALTEVQSWVRQRGEWGFFLSPAESQQTGYNAPGVRFALQVNGFMPRVPRKTLTERVATLERERDTLELKLQRLQGQVVKMRLEQGARPTPVSVAGSSDASSAESAASATGAVSAIAPTDSKAQVLAWLDSLSVGLLASPPNGATLSGLLAQVPNLPLKARALFAGLAIDTTRSFGHRLAATVAMGHTRDSALVAPLKWVTGDPDPRLRREALTALGRIGHPSALEAVKRLIDDPDPVVSVTAEEVAATLAPVAKTPPAAKTAPAPKARQP